LSHTEHFPSSLRKQPVSVYENDRYFVMIGIQNTLTFVTLQLVLIRQSLDFKWLKKRGVVTIVVALRTGQWKSWSHSRQEQHVFFVSMGSTPFLGPPRLLCNGHSLLFDNKVAGTYSWLYTSV